MTDAPLPDITHDGTPIPVPSGQTVTLQDVVWNAPGAEGFTYRFRFVAPAIAPGGGIDFDTATADMAHLCETFVLPRLPAAGPVPVQVIVSLSDVALPFGEAAPDATQYFEGYSVADGTCVWEPF